jgi:hypothetical protein
MKKELLLAFAIGTLSAPTTMAQISYVFSDLPVIGDQITRYRDTISAYGQGPAGPNQHWMFPAPVQHETITTSVVAPANTPHSAQFGGSNMAMTNNNTAYIYFQNNTNAMVATGAAGDLLGNGGNMTAVFNPTLTVHNFPRTYGSTGEDTYYFEVITTDHGIALVHSVRLRHYGHVYDTTDGYGQITTPVGTYECLRVKSTDFTIDSVWTKLFSFSPWALNNDFTGPGVSTSYSWIAKETKLNVAELSINSQGEPRNFTWSSIPPLTTGIADTGKNGMHIYPQPASGSFTVQLSEGSEFLTAELLALDGRIVQSIAILNRNRFEMEAQGLAPGMYLLRLLPANGSGILTRKVIIN